MGGGKNRFLEKFTILLTSTIWAEQEFFELKKDGFNHLVTIYL